MNIKMANKWITHIEKTMKTMKSKGTYEKGKGLSQVMKEAKKSWHKGGAVPVAGQASPVGGRRKTARKTRGRK